MGSGFITTGARAFVEGLARRVKVELRAPWLLHISGCTNLVHQSKQPFEWNDQRGGQAIFDYMKPLDIKSHARSEALKSRSWRLRLNEAYEKVLRKQNAVATVQEMRVYRR